MTKLTGDDFSRLLIVIRLLSCGDSAKAEIQEWRQNGKSKKRLGMDTTLGAHLMSIVMEDEHFIINSEYIGELDAICGYAGVENKISSLTTQKLDMLA